MAVPTTCSPALVWATESGAQGCRSAARTPWSVPPLSRVVFSQEILNVAIDRLDRSLDEAPLVGGEGRPRQHLQGQLDDAQGIEPAAVRARCGRFHCSLPRYSAGLCALHYMHTVQTPCRPQFHGGTGVCC
jgi:hypothetical protein